MGKNLAELCPCLNVLRKVELASNEIGYLSEAVSEQKLEAAAWVLLTTYSRMQKEKSDSKMNC